MPIAYNRRNKMLSEILKFSFHHRAFYCYLGMTIWIFFLVSVTYKYMAISNEPASPIKIEKIEHISKIDAKYRKLLLKTCNPIENIARGSEGISDFDTWLMHGVMVITRHGDRGPLTHLRGGDKLPCDTEPVSSLYKSYVSWVYNASAVGRVPVSPPFRSLPALPPRAATSCALGQLTPSGLDQMISVGSILRDAYAEKLDLDNLDTGKKDTGWVASLSTRYRRTFMSLCGAWWGLGGAGAGLRLARAGEAHALTFCFSHCACASIAKLTRKLNSQSKKRLESHSAIKDLVNKLSNVLFESQEKPDPDVVKDAILAYMCHNIPLPCSQRTKPEAKPQIRRKHRKFRNEHRVQRSLLDVDIDTLNMELDYINNNVDFNNELGRKARDIIGKYYDSREKQKNPPPLDFDAQLEREKLLYYQQRYLDNDGYDDIVIVKKNLDADFNFPNDARMDDDFDEDYKEPTPSNVEDFCIKNEHVISLFSYIEWSYRQDIKNDLIRRRGLLIAYGLIHNIVQNMIRMISDNKPKLVLYSGHDKTLQPLILALGLTDFEYYNIKYASRLIFELYRKKELLDEFKFTKRKAVAQDFYFRVVYNGVDVTNELSFCKGNGNIVTKVEDPSEEYKVHTTYLCPIENIVRFIHDDYFSVFNASNYKDACAT